MNNKSFETIITDSQHCQRNWDLSKNIKAEDIETLKVAVKQCPSKQNRVFYKALFIQDRPTIESFHSTTLSYTIQWDPYVATYNDQTLANLLVVLVRDRDYTENPRVEYENDGGVKKRDDTGDYMVKRDEDRALGVAGGYIALTAHQLGYKTGFYDGQHNQDQTKELLGEDVLLVIGVGHPDATKHYRDSHDNVFDGEDGLSRFYKFDKNINVEEI